MNIQELKLKSSEQLITQAEELGIENASTLRKQEILFAILKKLQRKKKLPEQEFCSYYKTALVFLEQWSQLSSWT